MLAMFISQFVNMPNINFSDFNVLNPVKGLCAPLCFEKIWPLIVPWILDIKNPQNQLFLSWFSR